MCGHGAGLATSKWRCGFRGREARQRSYEGGGEKQSQWRWSAAVGGGVGGSAPLGDAEGGLEPLVVIVDQRDLKGEVHSSREADSKPLAPCLCAALGLARYFPSLLLGATEALTRQLNDKSLPPRSRWAVTLTLWSLGAHPPLKAQLADAGAIETLVAFAKAGVALPPPTQPRHPPPLPSSSSRPRPLRSLPSPPPPSPQLPCPRQGALAQRRAAAGGV